MGTSTEVEIDLETLFIEQVPCSGQMHHKDPVIHGDPDQPAEYLIKTGCRRCAIWYWRPVCKFFAFGFAKNPYQAVFCSKCQLRGMAPEFFLDLRPL